MASLAARRATISNCLWAFSRLQRCGLVDLNSKGEEHLSLSKITRVARQSALAITKIHLRGLACSATPNMSRDHKEEHELFESWISEHGRVYKDTEEKQHRFNIFKDNLVFLDALKKHYGPRHENCVGPNMFSDMTYGVSTCGCVRRRELSYDVYDNEVSEGLRSADILSSGTDSARHISQHGTPYAMHIQGPSLRSWTKVHKHGITIGRSVNLTKFDNYDELITELDQLFEFGGELMAAKTNWLLFYTCDDDFMKLVGDALWWEFCAMNPRIFIYPRDKVPEILPSTAW